MTINKKAFLLLILLMIILTPLSSSLAKGEPVYINPFIDEYTVTSKDNLVIRHGWGACSEGLTYDYMKSLNDTFFLNGKELLKPNENSFDFWEDPYHLPDTSGIDLCIWDVEYTWVSYWNYEIGKLKPGDYELIWHKDHNYKIIDGFDLEGDGVPDVYGESRVLVTQIHVIDKK